MTSTTQTARDQPPRREKGLIGKVLGLPFALLGLLLTALFFSVLSEWIGLFFFWPEEGWHHSRDMLNSELDWVSVSFTQSLLLDRPAHTLQWVVAQAYEWGFEKTGLIGWIKHATELAQSSNHSTSAPQHYLGRAYEQVEDYGLAAVYAVLTLLVRVTILVLTLPLVLTAVLIGAGDGLVRRDLRRFGAGRESGFIYHRARQLILPVAVAPWIIYPALPITVNPMLVILPGALALGLVVSITVGSFKKYL
ncbi:TIGR03747 family integrating conjugative element membrane protein [Pseudomonas asplenii]|uniref:TIGR03747 family integrating conjugative element membrane protein n=1 Tax=Pseudomonas asplenii TaxID=53407 RepID=UPI0003A1D844|nr:TIGR03747 family integrating conjugative element membrane protein [Pseudomonas fuscovaginae]